jgi:hypothetical protein
MFIFIWKTINYLNNLRVSSSGVNTLNRVYIRKKGLKEEESGKVRNPISVE